MRRKMQLTVYVDGTGQGKEVDRVDHYRVSGGPDMRQVEGLKRELTNMNWEGRSGGEIEQ